MQPLKLKWWISLAVIACVVFTGGWAFAQQAQGLSAVGLTNPANGYPKWYQDGHGLRLEPCLDNNANDPCGLVAAGALPNPAAPVVFPTNFPDEFFYMRATARIDGIGGGVFRADLILALEGAFGGPTGTVADGNGAQITFARYRFKVNGGLVPGATYTVTAPFGTRSFVAAATGTVIFTSQQGCAAVPPACDFTLALPTPEVGPFLTWDPAASVPPAGYIGQPAIPHAIIGSPLGTNMFRISGPNVGGAGVNVVETNLFNVTGKIFVPPATSTSLTSTPNPSVTGQTVTLSATVSPVVAAPEALNGTVTFRDGATSLGVVTLVNGSASLTISTLAVGSHSLTAAYSGSPDFAASTSAVLTQTVNPGSTSTSLTSTPNPSTVGQAVTLSSTVSAVAPATGVPTGTVTFSDGVTTLGVVTLVNGSASLVTSALAAGTHSLTAVYSGSASFQGSTSPVVIQTVNAPAPAPASTSTSLTSTPNPSFVGQAVTLTATVSPVPPATGVPTGTVTFKDGATSLGVVTLVNGSASLTISTLAAGTHSLTAVYSRSATFAASTSPAVTQTVKVPDTVSITRADLVRQTGELRVEGVNGRIPGDGFAGSVEIHNGAASAGTCPGALIGSAAVGAADGKWVFRTITNLGPTTVCVKSAGGGVATRAVTQK